MSLVDILLRPNMRDPLPPPSLLVQSSKSFADKLSLTTLPYHVHEILLGFLGYHFILHVLSPTISRLVCPKIYKSFNKRTRLNWDIHWVSMVQALFICAAALWVIFKDEQRHEMDWRGRLWGYTPASGMVQGFAAGYFLWDLQISAQYINVAGVSSLIHAIGALAVTCIGFVRSLLPLGVAHTDYLLETLWKLLRPVLCPLRTLHPVPQYPLVLRQARNDRLKAPVVQRHRPSRHLLRLSHRLGIIPICHDLLGHLQGTHHAQARTHELSARGPEVRRDFQQQYGSRGARKLYSR
jgi:hypothetical protein